jgi:hypothetical protein
MILTDFNKCCMSSAMDETGDDMLWNGSREDVHVSSQCEEDEGTVKMETVTLIGKGR